jgi:hypothetical protein
MATPADKVGGSIAAAQKTLFHEVMRCYKVTIRSAGWPLHAGKRWWNDQFYKV